jgi:hypothetical protein
MYYEDDMIQIYDQHLIENEINIQHDVLKEKMISLTNICTQMATIK